MSVPVVYYLSRNGQLDHPHFILVPLSSSSPNRLFLRDVILRLTILRGKSMPSHYSWSSKRSYKNGYVWQDLEENDFIQPVHGGEYVLKGCQIVELPSPTSSSSSLSKSPETTSSSSSGVKIATDFSDRRRNRNQSWGAIEYQVYKSDTIPEFSGGKTAGAADASTQTDDKRRRRNKLTIEQQKQEEEVQKVEELSRDEISPPPSDSSPETLESLMKADGRLLLPHQSSEQTTVRDCSSGRMKASSVLMSLISCGSVSFRDCGVAAIKDHGFSSLVSRAGSARETMESGKEGEVDVMMEVENSASVCFAKMALEDKEYFSGSLIQTKKDDFIALKRSSSYNADRSSRLKLSEKEEDGVKAKCIPRRSRIQIGSSKKEYQAQMTGVTINNTQDGSQT